MDIGRHLIEIVSRNLKAERIRAGLSQQKLADKAGLSVRYISRLETNPQDFRIGKVAVLADALGIAPAQLLQHPGEKPALPQADEVLGKAIRLLESLRARSEEPSR
jgi:transcriptional regulator with XRE-family HTH domain